MSNPIKELRTQLALTQTELADLSGISQQGVLRYEQSLYEEPSEKLVDALVELEYPRSPASQDTLRKWIIDRYKTDRVQIQQSAARLFQNPPLILINSHEHPFITWRSKCLGTSSRMKFCILLAVHPGTVAEYEKGRRRYMPRQLREALLNAAVGKGTLDRLDHAGALYYDDMRHKK